MAPGEEHSFRLRPILPRDHPSRGARHTHMRDMQDWAFYPHTNDSVLAAGIFLDDVDSENGPTMVVPASHKAPIMDHHTDFGKRGRLFVGGIESTHCDTSAAVELCGGAGSVSLHHVRAVHGSNHNRSTRDRRILFIECVGADAWPLLGCPEFQGDDGGVADPAKWWHHAPAEFDASTCALRSPIDPTLCLPLTMPATDGRGVAMMGRVRALSHCRLLHLPLNGRRQNSR
jgi:ectoine hydroxylase-related dioxygenase (phytanoyl-CoA dioxygenase family)